MMSGASGQLTILDEVAPAHRFGGVLQAADVRDRVQRGVDGAAEQPLPAYCRPEREQRDGRTDPGDRTAETPGDLPLSVPRRPRRDGHAFAPPVGSVSTTNSKRRALEG